MNITVEAATLQEITPFIERALDYDTTGGAASLDDYRDALKFKVVAENHEIVGGYALTISDFKKVRTVCINTAAGYVKGVDLTRTILDLIRSQARQLGAAQLVLCTARKSFVKKLEAQGFTQTGFILRENL